MALALTFSIQQGVSFTPGSTQAVGHLLSATICGAALTADLTVTNPQTRTSAPAAGVLQQIEWAEGAADPIYMSAFVSAHNQVALRELLLTTMAATTVKISFLTHEFDPVARRWYSAFEPATPPLSGLLSNTSTGPQLTVATTATAVGSASLYQVKFAIVPPASTVENLEVAASATQPVIKTWGVPLVVERSSPG
jgi:hypothetical protein